MRQRKSKMQDKQKIDKFIDIRARLSKNAITAMERLEEAGYEAYIVGGSLRDILMDRNVHDFDITSSAKPEKVMEVLSDFKVIPTGLKHGTVTVLIEDEPVEITTFRSESGYSDGRHPDRVSFAKSVEDDLGRRDFTMNAMACRINGELVDLFGGQKDIANKLIRTVGDAKERFSEDGLRILRAIRFAAVLGFEVEAGTRDAIHHMAYMIEKVSEERIVSEFNKIMLSENPSTYLREYKDIICIFIPELEACIGFDQKNHHHVHDVFEHTLRVIDNTPSKLDLRLAALFHDISKPICFEIGSDGEGHFYGHASKSAEMAENILRRLKYDNVTITDVCQLVKYHDHQIENSDKIIKRMLRRLGDEDFFNLLDLKRADNYGQSEEFRYRQDILQELERSARRILEENACFSLKDMAIKGSDLIKLGMAQGPEIGEVLEMLLDKVISGEIKNDRQELIACLKDTGAIE